MKILAMLYLFVIIFLTMFGILNIDLNNFNLDDISYDKGDPDIVIVIRLLSWQIEFEKRKEPKMISEESLPVAWHPNRW